MEIAAFFLCYYTMPQDSPQALLRRNGLMPNPFLPCWEHIPDGEPRLFGERVYLYGSHDRPRSDSFCDMRLKAWSAPAGDLGNWTCHGDIFHSQADQDHESDVSWLENGMLYAPDAIQINGKYYLFVYLFYGRGCVAESDRPEGPFRLLHAYTWGEKEQFPQGVCENGVLVDPGVLLDDDGQLYVFGGYEKSWAARLNPQKPWQVIPDSYVPDILPAGEPFRFFEACSPRKIGGLYYLVYSPRTGSRLVYATADRPLGPYTYRGVIVDNGQDYPGGNNHGGLCKIGDQWYIFYHRATNGTVFSRQACAEPVSILPDGTIPQVPMTSMGLTGPLNPFEPTPAYRCCVLRGGCVKELSPLRTVVANLKDKSVVGYRDFDFGLDRGLTPLRLVIQVRGNGEEGRVHVRLDDAEGQDAACLSFSGNDETLCLPLPPIIGRHALYFVLEDPRRQMDWGLHDRELIQLEQFVFLK